MRMVLALALGGLVAALGASAVLGETGASQYQTAFGIDYSHPETYLAQGVQSKISDPAQLGGLRGRGPSLTHLGEIYKLIHTYETYSSGGATIGKATANQILSNRRLSGCHDFALIFSAIAREVGYPTVMVDTADAGWVTRFQKGESGPHVGHVFVEVFLVDRWILVNPTDGHYVEHGYDPANGAFRQPGGGYYGGASTGYLVLRKGVDTQGYGIYSNAQLTATMDIFAKAVVLATVVFPDYSWSRFGG